MVTVEYEYARNMRTRNLPRMHADLKTALTKHSKAARTFLEIPPSHRREYLQYVAEAKKPETRQRRIARIIKMLSAWKKKSSK